MTSVFTPDDVAQHASASDCWIIIDGLVYDVTSFLSSHPGGKKILLREGGKDATGKFHAFHAPSVLRKYGPSMLKGALRGHEDKLAGGKTVSAPSSGSGTKQAVFGDQVPFADPSWYQHYASPYFRASHIAYRERVRRFVQEEVEPHVREWDESSDHAVPRRVIRRAAELQLLPAVVGPPWPSKYAGPSPTEDFDSFHEMIFLDELSRCGSAGVSWGIWLGLSVGLPPVLQLGSDELKRKVAGPCLRGEKFIALAVSEPETASDVASLHTTARREGDYFILNGAKKWITNGTWADYFTVACRTGEEGHRGLSFLLVERNSPGVSTRHMKCMGMWASGTAYITFEDVKVPASHLLGSENQGFKYIMYNFNHERWGAAIQATRFSRVLYEEAFNYALKRKTFGKPLMDHQVIRAKLAEMARHIEATYSWLETITYQMTQLSKEERNQRLGGAIALLKVQSSKTMEYCAREAAQIFGGASYVRGGAGEKVERLYREVRAFAIPGGSEEILADYCIRSSVKAVKNHRRSRL